LQEFEEKFAIEKEICVSNGYVFEVWTEDIIRVEPKLGNIKFLFNRYSRVNISQVSLAQVAKALCNNDRLHVQQLENDNVRLEQVYSMIYHGYLQVDLMLPLSSNSIVWLQ
jgi:hypothetical protein